MRLLIFIGVVGILLPIVAPIALAEETQPTNANRANTKEEQSRQIQIETKRLEMELKEQLMKKKLVELENLKAMMMEANNIVTVSEVNKAEEDYETAVSEYEQAKLTLQQVELDSLKDEWHITVENTNLYESADGRELFSITLRNSSSPVTLVESSKVLDAKLSLVHKLTTSSCRLKSRKVTVPAAQLSRNPTNNLSKHSKKAKPLRWNLNSSKRMYEMSS